MGKEAKCVLRTAGQRYEGRALLETRELIFRGAEYRLKILFSDIEKVQAADGELEIKTNDGVAIFEVRSVAGKWLEKILHPKSRLEKLGVKAGTRVALLGEMDPAFTTELRQSEAQVLGKDADSAELLFLLVADQAVIKKVNGAARELKSAAGLWIVYPKGKKEITEQDVINAGRKAGLKDVKVVGFSATHTALKFVIPLDQR